MLAAALAAIALSIILGHVIIPLTSGYGKPELVTKLASSYSNTEIVTILMLVLLCLLVFSFTRAVGQMTWRIPLWFRAFKAIAISPVSRSGGQVSHRSIPSKRNRMGSGLDSCLSTEE